MGFFSGKKIFLVQNLIRNCGRSKKFPSVGKLLNVRGFRFSLDSTHKQTNKDFQQVTSPQQPPTLFSRLPHPELTPPSLQDPLPHMATLPHKSLERAYRNILHTTISTLWRRELLNHDPLHLPHTNRRKTSYIHIARDDLQRRDLFNLHNTCAPTLTNCPSSTFEPRPHVTFHLTSSQPMTTHTPLMTNVIVPLASLSRSWVMNSTPSYTAPTLPPSLTPPSSALSALFADMTSALDPHTPFSNKLLFSSDLPPVSSFANRRKHGLTLPPLCAKQICSLQSHFKVLKHQPSASPRPIPSLPSSLDSPPSEDTGSFQHIETAFLIQPASF